MNLQGLTSSRAHPKNVLHTSLVNNTTVTLKYSHWEAMQ